MRTVGRILLLDHSAKMVAVMVDHWFTQFGERFNFPDSYTTIDCETSGVNCLQDLVCTFGLTQVRDRQPLATREWILDWTRHPQIDQAGLRHKLDNVQQAMNQQGKAFHHSYEMLRAHGVEPIAALTEIMELMDETERRQEVIVAHNGWKFDIEMLQQMFHNHVGEIYEFADNSVYDSGAVEKASQLQPEHLYDHRTGIQHSALPEPGETMRTWSLRIVNRMVRGVYWALDRHCEPKYGIYAKCGFSVEDAHKSGTDSRVLHVLFEEHRRLAGLAKQVDIGDPNPQAIFDEQKTDPA